MASFKVLIAGGSGMIGRALSASLSQPNMLNRFKPAIYTLVRRKPTHEREIFWDPMESRIDIERLEGFDAIVNLSGENIGSGEGLFSIVGRWTPRKKHAIMESRRRGNALLANAAAALVNPPKVLIVSSGVGYYGNCAGTVEAPLTEASPVGRGFLAEVASVSEDHVRPAIDAGIRTVMLRTAPVLSRDEGMLGKLMFPFSWGLGGRVGSGSQYMSWVTLEDAVRAIEFIIRREDITGPVNLCAPSPITNARFTSELASALRRPAFMHLPEAVVKAIFGEMADETLLASQYAIPAKLQAAGFRFLHSDITTALAAVLRA